MHSGEPSHRTSQPTLNIPTTSFKPPAHKHAHIIHSIPPKEKNTRMLIIDHMLWVHGRTRFAQARAELGMTDRTGGQISLNYTHRLRPEHYEEDEEVPSDGESDSTLKARTNIPNAEEERLHQFQDLTLARQLRLRSQAVEKVVTSMLNQPPSYHPPPNEDLFTPPSSPKLSPGQRDPAHPHTIPNGIRLRLALGTLVNDLFARQAPMYPQNKPNSMQGPIPPTQGYTNLPSCLSPFATISKRNLWLDIDPKEIDINDNASNIPTQMPSARTLEYYSKGVDLSSSTSPSSKRCPRHLHHGCEICVTAQDRTSYKPSRSPVAPMASTFSAGPSFWNSQNGTQQGAVTGWLDGAGIGSGLAGPDANGTVLRRIPPPLSEVLFPGDAISPGEGNVKLSILIPRFIRLSALVAIELGLEARDDISSDRTSIASLSPEQRPISNMMRGTDRVAPLSPLSLPITLRPALVSNRISALTSGQDSGRLKQLSIHAFRPSRSWYLMLSGLLTRAVLQGYLTAGWRGREAVDCLLTLGLAFDHDVNSKPSNESLRNGGMDDDDIRFKEFDPDYLPTLRDAVLLLFPSLRGGTKSKDGDEAAYEHDMYERLRKFYSIPALTPDLATHMEDIAYLYPAEPIERAAVRFVEAVAKWRGKPELENNKKNPPRLHGQHNSQGPSMMTVDSLVNASQSATIPPVQHSARISIHQYFMHPVDQVQVPHGMGSQHNPRDGTAPTVPLKRARSQEDLNQPFSKRVSI